MTIREQAIRLCAIVASSPEGTPEHGHSYKARVAMGYRPAAQDLLYRTWSYVHNSLGQNHTSCEKYAEAEALLREGFDPPSVFDL